MFRGRWNTVIVGTMEFGLFFEKKNKARQGHERETWTKERQSKGRGDGQKATSTDEWSPEDGDRERRFQEAGDHPRPARHPSSLEFQRPKHSRPSGHSAELKVELFVKHL